MRSFKLFLLSSLLLVVFCPFVSAQESPFSFDCELIEGRIVKILPGSGGFEISRVLVESADATERTDFYMSVHKHKTAIYEAGRYRSTWTDPRTLEVGDTVAAWYLTPQSTNPYPFPADVTFLYQSVLVGVSADAAEPHEHLYRLPEEVPPRPADFGVFRLTMGKPVRSVFPAEAPFERPGVGASGLVILELLVAEDGAVQDAAPIQGIQPEIDYVLDYLIRFGFRPPAVQTEEGPAVGTIRVQLNR